MNTTSNESAGHDRLSYPDCLPLIWRPLSEPLGSAEAQALCSGNLQVLAAVAAIEEHGRPADEEAPLDREIARLHRKVDLLLEIVSGLLRVQQALPAAVPLHLSAQDLVWHGAGAPVPGNGVLEIYLHRSVLHPLKLMARAETGSDAPRVVFLPMDESTAAALETHVFLHHRRSVAEARLSQKR